MISFNCYIILFVYLIGLAIQRNKLQFPNTQNVRSRYAKIGVHLFFDHTKNHSFLHIFLRRTFLCLSANVFGILQVSAQIDKNTYRAPTLQHIGETHGCADIFRQIIPFCWSMLLSCSGPWESAPHSGGV